MFGRDRRVRALAGELEQATLQLAEVRGLLTEKAETLNVVAEYEQVKKRLADAEIDAAKLQEKHDRERREIEHHVGLHKLQVEHEIANAKKEAELAVREEGLNAQKDQFQDQMKFMEARMQDEIASQRDLMEKILGRLPNFERSHHTVEHIGTPPPDLTVKQIEP